MNYLLLIQTLVASIKAVDQLMPDSKGKDKFEAVVAMVEAVVGSVTPQIPALVEIATLMVNAFRKTGTLPPKTGAGVDVIAK